MAHVQKFSKSAVAGLSSHIERKTLNHSNEDIDTDKSDLNYDLCEKEGINDHQTLKNTQRKNETLTDRLNRTETNLKGVEHARSNLRLEVEELSKENKTLQEQSIVLESILEDKGATVADITDLEFDGRLILDKIERGIAPKTKQQGADWLDTLEENKKNKTIEPKRLENALERLKIMIDKLLTKLKSFSHER